MKGYGWVGALVVVLVAGTQTRAQDVPSVVPVLGEAPFVFRQVTVVDVEAGRTVPGQTVVIVGNRIHAVGRDPAIPAGAREVDARGKYLLPGLWDMHTHVRQYGAFFYPFFLANGITGIREMDQPWGFDTTRAVRNAILAGQRVGPRVIGTGRMLRLPGEGANVTLIVDDHPVMTEVGTPEEARAAVRALHAAGADLVKLHSEQMSRAIYFAIAHEARRLGIPFVGHLPKGITLVEAADSGQRSVEHFNLFPSGCFSRPDAPEICAEISERFRHNGAWFTPTLIVLYDDTTAYARHLASIWPGSGHTALAGLAQRLGPAKVRGLVASGQKVVGANHRAGIPLLAGTDVSVWSPVTVHQELELLVKSGLTPAEALRTATLNPARYLDARDSLGTVAPDKLADFLVLDADPLTDIRHTRAIQGVMANGRYFDRHALDAVLRDAEKAAQRLRLTPSVP